MILQAIVTLFVILIIASVPYGIGRLIVPSGMMINSVDHVAAWLTGLVALAFSVGAPLACWQLGGVVLQVLR